MSFIGAREHGAKVGSAGIASEQQQGIDRRERLRRLALETIDLKKDPYFFRNHLGQIECRLCLTLHTNEGNYLAHTQGKRHQQNLAKRAAREASEKPIHPAPKTKITPKKTVKIGKPGYRITKQFDPDLRQRSLLFQIDYPEIHDGEQPKHRFMSSYEQKKEAADKKYQYVLFAAEPYEVIAFKVPNAEVDKSPERFFSHWDPDNKVYSLSISFKSAQAALDTANTTAGGPLGPQPPGRPPIGLGPGAPPRPPTGIPAMWPPRGPGLVLPPRPPVPPGGTFPRPPLRPPAGPQSGAPPLPFLPSTHSIPRPPMPPRAPGAVGGPSLMNGPSGGVPPRVPPPANVPPILRPPAFSS